VDGSAGAAGGWCGRGTVAVSVTLRPKPDEVDEITSDMLVTAGLTVTPVRSR
jgi:hypothetical protein